VLASGKDLLQDFSKAGIWGMGMDFGFLPTEITLRIR